MAEQARVSQRDVQAAVRALHGDAARLVDYQVAPATSQGFSSLMLRVQATLSMTDTDKSITDLQHKKVSWMVKCLPEVASQLEVLADNNIFEREVLFFLHAAPLLKHQSRVAPPIVTHFSARSDQIVMEDLSTLGFEMLAKEMKEVGENNLELSHVKLVMEKLAILHASSVDQDWLQILPYLYKDCMIEGDASPFVTWFKKSCEAYAKALPVFFPDVDPKIVQWLCSEKSFETLLKFVKPDTNNLNVLSHGDFWINNMMFKLDNNNIPIDVRFIDFQMCKFVPPSRDFQHFLYTNKSKSFRDKYETELLHAYVKSFNDTLGYEKLTLVDFLIEYESSRMYGVFLGLVYRTMNFMPEIYPGEGEVMSQDMYQVMISGEYFNMLEKKCSDDFKFNTMVKDLMEELIQEAPRFLV